MNNLLKLMCIGVMSSGMAQEGLAYSAGAQYDTNQAQTQAEQTKTYYDNKRSHTITDEFQADKQAAQNEVSDTKAADKQTAQSDYPGVAAVIPTLQDIKKEYDNTAEEIESNPEELDTLEGYQAEYENDPEAQATVDDDKAQAQAEVVSSYEDGESE